MSRRGNKLDAKPTKIENNSIQYVYICFTGVAATGAHLTQFKGAPQESPHSFIKCLCELQHFAIDDKIGASPNSELIVLTIADGSFWACVHAFGAKQASAQIECHAIASEFNSARWTRVGTVVAARYAFLAVNKWPSAKPVRQRGLLVRKWNCPVALQQACTKEIKHAATSYKSCPQYDRLKLLLHNGKSEICWSLRAIATPIQL
jgi:hypothetical protein